MSKTSAELRYAHTHEWARLEDGVVIVGISDYAQDALGDIVYVDLPEVDQEAKAGEEVCVVESVKAAADVFAPVSGVVVAVNAALEEKPELVNEDSCGEGWFYKLAPRDIAELDALMDAEAYQKRLDAEEAEQA